MGAKLLALFWAWLALSQSLYVSQGVVSASITTPLPDLYEASVIELQAGLTSGQFTSVDLIKVCKHAVVLRIINRLQYY
jgi:amidase